MANVSISRLELIVTLQYEVAKAYLVVDACIHTEPYKRAEKDIDYKLYIMELAMEWVEEKCRVELSRSTFRIIYSGYYCSVWDNHNNHKQGTNTRPIVLYVQVDFELPNMKSKDELKKRSIILPKPPAIQEMGDISGTKQHTPPTATTTTATPSKTQEDLTAKPAKGVSGIVVPIAGKDDIALRNRQLPCLKGTLGIIVEVDLPNHVSTNTTFYFSWQEHSSMTE